MRRTLLLFNPLSPFHWPRNIWPWLSLNGMNVHYTLQYCDLRSCLQQFSSYLFTVEYVYAAARHATRIDLREVEFRIAIRRIFGIGETLHRRNVNNYRQNYDIVLVLHCISTDSKHCLIEICIKFCFAPICLELWSLGFRSLSI